MAKKVVCKYCGITFDRDKEEYEKISTRYAHKSCCDKARIEAADFRKLTDLVKSLYSPKEPDWKLIGSQLKRYKDEGMTYMGMYYTLTYFFVIKKNNIHEGKGVGIIPYAYQRAKSYYTNLDNTYTKAADIQSREKINIKQTENIITITQSKPKKRLIDFDY